MFATVRGFGLDKVIRQFAISLSLCTAVAGIGAVTAMPAEGRSLQQVVAGASDNNWPVAPTGGTDNNWPKRLMGAADNNWPIGVNGGADNNWPTGSTIGADNNWPVAPNGGTDNNWPKA